MFRNRIVFFVITLFAAAYAHAQTDFTGVWTGAVTQQKQCPSGPMTITGTMVMSLQQSGSNVTGGFSYTAPQNPCTSSTIGTLSASVSGTVSGSTLSATVTASDSSTTTMTAILSGSQLAVGIAPNGGGTGSAVTGVLSRQGSTGTSDFTGTWTGSVSGTLPCGGDPTAQFPATAMLHESGSTVTGTVVISNGLCTGSSSFTVPVSGTLVVSNEFFGEFSSGGITNGAIVGVLGAAGTMGIGIAFTNSSGQDVSVGGLLTGGSSTAPLAVNSFAASPNTIRAGQSATLAWSVQGASSVSIDNGVGTVSPFGTTTISPSTTTTYTLTAMQGTTSLTSQATVTVLTGPVVNLTALPSAMLQPAGVGGGATSYALTNSGSASVGVTLSQNGSFFTQTPASFTLAAGATQVVTITGTAQPAGSYQGSSTATAGSTTLQVPVELLSAAPPSGTVTATPPAPRVDVAAPTGSASASGSVQFTNTGNATLTGILSSDVPWIIPQSGVVTIAPGATGTFTFQIDRTKRPDSAAPIGSVEGSLFLSFLSGGGTSFAAKPLDNTSTTPSVSLVKIVDTAQPSVTSAGVPALGTGEVALFVSGAGHVSGTGGTQFVSDVNVLNVQGSKSIDDLKMYYTPSTSAATSSKTASLPSVPGSVSVAVADVVKNVFSGSNEVGTIQVRSKDADKLAVAATVLTTNNPTGMFGNTIPVFRSDRAVDTSNTLVLTGVRKDANTHTNLYIQETAGSPATVQIDYLAADGTTVSSSTQSIDTFRLLQMVDAVPATAVAAVITNTSTAGGKISAYATPVDQASTDTWAVADWSKQYAYAGTDPVIFPIAGSVHGANNTFYRTDVSITNRGTSSATGTLRYVSRDGQKIDRAITLGSKQTNVITDAVGGLFGVSGESTGYLVFTPASGSSFAVSSRTYTTAGSSAGTFGSGVPALAAAAALRVGGTRPIAGLEDAARTTVVAGKPGTFRTNFALMETSGNAVTIRVTFRFTFPAGAKAQGVGAASRDYNLGANQFLMLNSIAGEILGPARLQYGDLTNVEADFQVVSGGGAVMLFTSSVDNSTGDSILRTE